MYFNSEGIAHACGHDGHTAMLLGACKLIQENKNKIPKDCTVRFVFQPAEEGFGGAKVMINENCLENVDEIYGIHNMPSKFGHMVIRPGVMMAQSNIFYIKVEGKGGHASMPHTTIDPTIIGCQIVLALQTIVSRNIDPSHTVVISCCKINCGEIANVLPDNYEIWGTIRNFNDKDFELVCSRMKEIGKYFISLQRKKC